MNDLSAPEPTPATLQQLAVPRLNAWELDSLYSTRFLSPVGTAGWSRGNAGLIAEMGMVWLLALAGGWLARRFAARAEAVDGRAG